jgi:hypothetical protein
VREQGVTNPGISPNHAWRHLCKTIARRAGIERPASETPSAGSADSYERASVEDMAEVLEKLPRYSI